MPNYLEHSKVIASVDVIETDGDDTFTSGTITVVEHHFVRLDEDGTKVISRDYDGVALNIHVDYDSDADGPATTTLRLDPNQTRTLKELLEQIEVPA